MSPSLAIPLAVALGVSALTTSLHRRLPPRFAARFVTVALALLVLAALPTALVVAVAFLAHAPVVGLGFQWCARVIGLHGAVSPWLGVPVVTFLAVGAYRAGRLLSEYRTLRVDDAVPIHVARSERPYAVTLPGRGGQIVISSAMVELLDERERRIVLAHEAAHARYRHDRYLLAAEMGAALVPPLRGLSKRIGYSIERWADDVAAAECGDRSLVAVTLGKVALLSQPMPRGVAGFAGLGVASRMHALLQPPVAVPGQRQTAMVWSALAVTAIAVLYQLHHLERLLTALCPH